MAPSPEGHRSESNVAAAAASGTAEPLAGADNGPRPPEVVILVDDPAGTPPDVEMPSQPASSDSVGQPAQEILAAEDGGAPPAASPVPSQNAAGAVDPLQARIEREIQEVRRRTVRPSICRVHPSIREQESEAYEPKLVSIGPLHRDKKSLKPMEEIKLMYLNSLLRRDPAVNNLGEYISVIRDFQCQARTQYAEEVEPETDEFVRMLVLDGCFIIEYLVKRVLNSSRRSRRRSQKPANQRCGCFINIEYLVDCVFNRIRKKKKKKKQIPPENQPESESQQTLLEDQSGSGLPPPEEEIDPLSSVRWGFSHLRRDLLLLENQIPFFVLSKLFEKSRIPFTGTRLKPLTLMEIALRFLDIKMSEMPEARRPQEGDVYHLLHLQHLCLNPNLIEEEPKGCSFCQVLKYPFKKTASLVSLFFFALLYIMLIRKWPFRCSPDNESEVPRMIPCATELHQCGVKFKKKVTNKEGGVYCYLKVSFTEGTLEIPFLSVEESTSSKLRNFIALEQCCPQVGSHFTSYAAFMDNIINTESDVAILRRYRIIESKLGSDEEVANMFNTLCKGTHLSYKEHYNAPLFRDVTEYCEVPHHRWRATLKGQYFGNPWSIISLVAGIVLIFLTVVQSYFTVYPRK